MSNRENARLRGLQSWVEIAAWTAGLACLLVYVVARAHGTIAYRQGLDAFAAARAAAATVSSHDTAEHIQIGSFAVELSSPDQSLWAAERIRAYEQSAAQVADLPRALLRIPSIGLTAPVYDGTGELNLNRGVGRIEGTARVGAAGNLGLAGHRDGFFRGLKDIRTGDVIEIETVSHAVSYRVSDIFVVDPDATHVLAETGDPAITLVTCYPFYYLGHAPQRYIVRGVLVGERALASEQFSDSGQADPSLSASHRALSP